MDALSPTEIVSPDGRMTALAAGPPEGQPVIFLHGAGGGAMQWRRQIEELARRGYRAIAVDLPGYGRSMPVEMASVGSYGDALGTFIRVAGLSLPVLVGHSFGGMIVQSYLADGLGPVRAAVLVQTSSAFGGRDPNWARDFIETRLRPLAQGETMAGLAERSVPAMMAPGAQPDAVATATRAMAETSPEAYRESLLSMVGFDRREMLKRIAVPSLLVAGELDEMAPATTMAKMAERIPGAEFASLAGTGHFAMLERPGQFGEILAGFLERVVNSR